MRLSPGDRIVLYLADKPLMRATILRTNYEYAYANGLRFDSQVQEGGVIRMHNKPGQNETIRRSWRIYKDNPSYQWRKDDGVDTMLASHEQYVSVLNAVMEERRQKLMDSDLL